MPYNWPVKIVKYGITCPFQKFLVAKYESLIDWNGGRITSAEALDAHIRETMIPDLRRRLDPEDKKSHYCRAINLAAVLNNPAEHFNEVRGIHQRDGEEAARKFLLERINRDKKEGFDAWWNYLTHGNPVYADQPAFQYIILRPIIETSDAKCTRQPFPLDAEAVAFVHDGIEKESIDPSQNLIRKLAEFTAFGARAEGDRPAFGTECIWITITNDMPNAAIRVAALSRGRGWCVASSHMAKSYLQSSDFHLLVEKGRAEVAIRIANGKAEEIQGHNNSDPGPWWSRILLYLNARAYGISRNHRHQAAASFAQKCKQELAAIKTVKKLSEILEKQPAKVQFIGDEILNDELFRPVIEEAWLACVKGDPMCAALAPEWMRWDAGLDQALINGWQNLLHTDPSSVTRMPERLQGNRELREDIIAAWRAIVSRQPLEYKSLPEEFRRLPQVIDGAVKAWASLISREPVKYNECPEDIRQDPDIMSARRKGWIRYCRMSFKILTDCPSDFRSDPELLNARKDAWIRSANRDIVSFELNVPDDLRNDPDMANIRRLEWIRGLRFRDLWDVLPPDLKSLPEAQKARREGWLLRVAFKPHQFSECPEDIRLLPEFPQALKKGWTNALAFDPDKWSECPDELRGDHDMIGSHVRGWIRRLENRPWDWTSCPRGIKQDAKVIEARVQGWAKIVKSRPGLLDECPEEVKKDPRVGIAALATQKARKLMTEETKAVREIVEALAGRRARYVDRRGSSIRFNYGGYDVTNQESLTGIGCRIVVRAGLNYVWADEDAIRRMLGHGESSNIPTDIKKIDSLPNHRALVDWSRILDNDPAEWKQCPAHVLELPQIIKLLRRRFIAEIQSNPTAFDDCPPALREDPLVSRARIESWVHRVNQDPLAWNNCPEELKSLESIIVARLDGWVEVMRRNPLADGNCPESLHADNQIGKAIRQGWISVLKEDPVLWNKCPAALQEEKEIMAARKSGWLARLRSMPLTEEDCPPDIRALAKFPGALKQGWIQTVQGDPRMWPECPADLRRDQDLVAALRDSYRKMLAESPDQVRTLPPEVAKDHESTERFLSHWKNRVAANPELYNDLPPELRAELEQQDEVVRWWQTAANIRDLDWAEWMKCPPAARNNPGIARRAIAPITRALRRNPSIWASVVPPWREMDELRQEAASCWAHSPACANKASPEDIKELVEELRSG